MELVELWNMQSTIADGNAWHVSEEEPSMTPFHHLQMEQNSGDRWDRGIN
jgi:hypothetical protein